MPKGLNRLTGYRDSGHLAHSIERVTGRLNCVRRHVAVRVASVGHAAAAIATTVLRADRVARIIQGTLADLALNLVIDHSLFLSLGEDFLERAQGRRKRLC